MQVLAVGGIVAAFATLCTVMYLVGRSLQRKGHDLRLVDPLYPDSMQAVGTADIAPPGLPYLRDDTSLGDGY
jgi:hypothetical protein